MRMELRVLTHLDKVFQDEAPIESISCFQGFENEKIDFQLAFRESEDCRKEMQLDISSPIERYITVRQVKQVPVAFPIASELQQLLDEQAQLRASLMEQNVDPELIDRIRHCVDTVIKAGEEPRQRESIRAQLAESLHRNSDISQQKQTNLHPNTPQKRTEDYRA